MTESPETGGYFSRNYLRSESPSQDSERMRLRIAAYLTEYFSDESDVVGRYIEKEVGIKIISKGTMTSYVNWETFLEKCPISDFLDILTACLKFKPLARHTVRGVNVVQDLSSFVSRVFRELNVAFRVDERGGIHPFIDLAFSAELSEIIKHLVGHELTAAKQSVDNAEMALLSTNYDGRAAVRSIFDAVENVFKQICPKSNQLNKANINNYLRPILLGSMANNPHEQRAAERLIDGLVDWTEAGHNFRHDPGNPEPNAPSARLATTYVSQGFSYVRLLADVFSHRKRQAE